MTASRTDDAASAGAAAASGIGYSVPDRGIARACLLTGHRSRRAEAAPMGAQHPDLSVARPDDMAVNRTQRGWSARVRRRRTSRPTATPSLDLAFSKEPDEGKGLLVICCCLERFLSMNEFAYPGRWSGQRWIGRSFRDFGKPVHAALIVLYCKFRTLSHPRGLSDARLCIK